jgi:FG-GAP-like repeat/IPT/TIG domain
MRTFITVAIFSFFLVAFCFPLAAQTYPMPFVNDPLVPAAAVPGGPGFTLTVNGAGFINGDVVIWNGSPRTTTFVGNTKLTAQIPASDIATASTVSVTVTNPHGGISNSILFLVTTPTTSLAFTRTDTDFSSGGSQLAEPTAITAIGASGLAIANSICPLIYHCLLEHSTVALVRNGSAAGVFTGIGPEAVGVADLTGAGSQDLITVGASTYSILRGSMDPHLDYPLPTTGLIFSTSLTLGDFDGDGHLDFVLATDSGVDIFLGNGDGTFGSPGSYDSGTMGGMIVAGDFNGDGKLDLAVSNTIANTISILLGNGDGTFQAMGEYSVGSFPQNIATADFNGDGKLDLAVVNNTSNVSIFLGNGDGTFQSKVDYPAGTAIQSLTIGDYNGDGVPDLAVSDSLCVASACPTNGSVNLLLGNGDGTFQSHLDFADEGQPGPMATGSFYSPDAQNTAAGRPGFATTNFLQNTVSIFDPVTAGPVISLPTISSISPSSAMINSGAFTITVNGTNFISSSTVYFGGQPRVTTFVSATQLTAAIEAGDLASPRAVSVWVSNPGPGSGDSTLIGFNVYRPPPTILSISPSSVVAGGPAFALTVYGSNFVTDATVNFNDTPRATTYISSTQLTTAISGSDIANQGTINISVTDPVETGSAGGTTSTLPLTVLPTNTQPVIGALVPASATAGGPAFTLKLSGTGFTASSLVTFNSSVVSSAFVSATLLQAAIPASAIAVAGTPFVTVTNPGGSPSLVTTFTVNNPVPGASSLSPSSVPAGNAAITLNVTGMNLNTSSTVLVNGSPRATSYVSSTSLNAALPAGDFFHSGTLSITVNNPAPGGGSTSALTFTVEDFNLNVQTPASSVPAGQPADFSLMLVPVSAATTNAVSFSASGLPAGATASFSPPTIPAGSGITTVTLSVATTPHSTASLPPAPIKRERSLPISGLWIVAFGAALGLGLLLALGRAQRQVPQFILASLLLIAAGLTACGAPGGGGSSSGQQLNPQTGTPAGTYPIIVTATSGTGSLSTAFTLTVK